MSSGIFNGVLGIGMICGPLFGSYITELYGFRVQCDCVALISLLFGLIYFQFGDGLNGFKKTIENRRKML